MGAGKRTQSLRLIGWPESGSELGQASFCVRGGRTASLSANLKLFPRSEEELAHGCCRTELRGDRPASYGETMGICPVRCRSNMSILENTSESATPAHEEAVTVSLCDYPAFGHIDLTMCIGEQLTILSDDGDFLIVRSVTTGLESYIPTTYTAKVTHTWLFAGISRYKAIELLMLPNNQSGSFLIRESETNTDCYSLSVLRRSSSPYLDSVKHYRISCLQNGWVYISPSLTFPSLHHLVEHYSEFADGLCCRLTAPCFIKSSDGESKLVPTTVRRSTINWKDISRSMIFKRKRTESDNSLVSEGLREAICSYLQMTEGGKNSWDT